MSFVVVESVRPEEEQRVQREVAVAHILIQAEKSRERSEVSRFNAQKSGACLPDDRTTCEMLQRVTSIVK